MWKRWLALLLAGMLVLCMTGCRRTGGGDFFLDNIEHR